MVLNSCSFRTQESVIHQQLKHALKGISHERADVKLHATRALQLCLHGNKVLYCISVCLYEKDAETGRDRMREWEREVFSC